MRFVDRVWLDKGFTTGIRSFIIPDRGLLISELGNIKRRHMQGTEPGGGMNCGKK